MYKMKVSKFDKKYFLSTKVLLVSFIKQGTTLKI